MDNIMTTFIFDTIREAKYFYESLCYIASRQGYVTCGDAYNIIYNNGKNKNVDYNKESMYRSNGWGNGIYLTPIDKKDGKYIIVLPPIIKLRKEFIQ